MTTSRASRCLAALAVLTTSSPLSAQNPTYPGQPAPPLTTSPKSPTPAAAVRVMRASRSTGTINIDGKMDEPAWAAAVPSGDFTQSYPNVGAKATDPTEVRILYDDDALYVGVRMFDSRPD